MPEESSNDLVISRVFDAPREVVYRAFIEPAQLAQWFGPVGFSVPLDTVEVDARPGGVQRLVMVSDADPAMASPVNARFTEVIENELLAGTEDRENDDPGLPTPLALRIEFHDEADGRTRIVLRQGPFQPETLLRLGPYSTAGEATRNGWESSFTKLDKLLAA